MANRMERRVTTFEKYVRGDISGLGNQLVQGVRVLVKTEGGKLAGFWSWKWFLVPITRKENTRRLNVGWIQTGC